MNYIEECLQRARNATPGPWKAIEEDARVSIESIANIPDNEKLILIDEGYLLSQDFYFIAHARQDIPELCRRLKAAIELLRSEAHISDKYIRMLEAPLSDIASQESRPSTSSEDK